MYISVSSFQRQNQSKMDKIVFYSDFQTGFFFFSYTVHWEFVNGHSCAEFITEIILRFMCRAKRNAFGIDLYLKRGGRRCTRCAAAESTNKCVTHYIHCPTKKYADHYSGLRLRWDYGRSPQDPHKRTKRHHIHFVHII